MVALCGKRAFYRRPLSPRKGVAARALPMERGRGDLVQWRLFSAGVKTTAVMIVFACVCN